MKNIVFILSLIFGLFSNAYSQQEKVYSFHQEKRVLIDPAIKPYITAIYENHFCLQIDKNNFCSRDFYVKDVKFNKTKYKYIMLPAQSVAVSELNYDNIYGNSIDGYNFPDGLIPKKNLILDSITNTYFIIFSENKGQWKKEALFDIGDFIYFSVFGSSTSQVKFVELGKDNWGVISETHSRSSDFISLLYLKDLNVKTVKIPISWDRSSFENPSSWHSLYKIRADNKSEFYPIDIYQKEEKSFLNHHTKTYIAALNPDLEMKNVTNEFETELDPSSFRRAWIVDDFPNFTPSMADKIYTIKYDSEKQEYIVPEDIW